MIKFYFTYDPIGNIKLLKSITYDPTYIIFDAIQHNYRLKCHNHFKMSQFDQHLPTSQCDVQNPPTKCDVQNPTLQCDMLNPSL